MANSTDPTDLVLSYVVGQNGQIMSAEPLQEALAKGYRVTDVLTSPAGTATVVTVVLEMWNTSVHPYRLWLK